MAVTLKMGNGSQGIQPSKHCMYTNNTTNKQTNINTDLSELHVNDKTLANSGDSQLSRLSEEIGSPSFKHFVT